MFDEFFFAHVHSLTERKCCKCAAYFCAYKGTAIANRLSMTFRSPIIIYAQITMTIFVCCASLLANAQGACSDLFSNVSAYRESFLPLKDLNNSTADLIEVLKNSPQGLDPVMLESKLSELEGKAEAYFQSAGIPFEKFSTSTQIKNLKGDANYTLFYPIYRLSGSVKGDEISRLIYGVKSNPSLKENELKVIFDLLYMMNYQSNGHFNPPSKTLFVGPHVLAQEVAGLGATFRHEVQHYFEQHKLIKGEMTLARMSLWEMSPVKDEAYAGFLRVDELETHLRDLRSLIHRAQTNKDQKLLDVLKSEEKLDGIKKTRQAVIESTYTRLESLIKKSQTTIANLEAEMKSGGFNSLAIDKKTGEVEAGFIFLPPPYSSAKIELQGLLKADDLSDKVASREKAKAAILQILNWNKLRIDQIANELKDLSVKVTTSAAQFSVTADAYSIRVAVPRETKVSELTDDEGNIWLFRVNVGPYKEGVDGSYTKKEGGVSTSLNPDIANKWRIVKEGQQTYVLLVRQNIFKDNLFYPGKGGLYVSAPKLTEQTKLSDIEFYDEVKVRTSDFNVVAQIPIERYDEVVKSFQGTAFTTKELAERLLRNSNSN